jgi:hypothetical protein
VPWSRASGLERAIACPASTHLPVIRDNPGEAAVWGTLVHSWKETGQWHKTLAARRRAAALAGAGLTRDTLWPSTAGTHEVSYALNTASRICDRYEGPASGRDGWKLSFDDNWITGTADWVGDILGDAWIDDLKTGSYVPSNPWDLWQLRFYALCAALLGGQEAVQISITHWPRYPADGAPHRIWAPPVQRGELLGVTLPLLEMARQAAVESKRAGVPVTQTGDHCHWCRAKPNCPEYGGDY